MLHIEKTKFDITRWESALFMTTSTLNLLPIVYALHKRLLFYGLTSFGTGVISVLYWRYPIHGWRRNVDMFYAKYTFLVYLGSGIYHIPYGSPALFLYLGASSIALFYCMNFVFPHIWIRFHMMVHLVSIFMKLYILFYLPMSSLPVRNCA